MSSDNQIDSLCCFESLSTVSSRRGAACAHLSAQTSYKLVLPLTERLLVTNISKVRWHWYGMCFMRDWRVQCTLNRNLRTWHAFLLVFVCSLSKLVANRRDWRTRLVMGLCMFWIHAFHWKTFTLVFARFIKILNGYSMLSSTQIGIWIVTSSWAEQNKLSKQFDLDAQSCGLRSYDALFLTIRQERVLKTLDTLNETSSGQNVHNCDFYIVT